MNEILFRKLHEKCVTRKAITMARSGYNLSMSHVGFELRSLWIKFLI